MKQRDGWVKLHKSLVIGLAILCVVLGAMLVWMARQKTGEEKQDYFEANAGRLWRSLKGVPEPLLDCRELAALLEKDECIRSREVYDMARWYVYCANEDVIRQLIANLANELELTLPEETNSTFIRSATKCEYMAPLVGFCPSPKHLGRILHRELLKYSADSKTDPHLIYLIMGCIHANDKNDDYWRSRRFFFDDMLAYIRIYANYSEWPTVTAYAARAIQEYPCEWFDSDTIDEVLRLARGEGAGPAYGLYVQRYRNNYHATSADMPELKDPNISYDAKTTFEGWCSEDVRGTTRVYDVPSDTATVGIPCVQKIVEVLRDGVDITPQCSVTTDNVMTIPLRQGKVVELEYRVHVTHRWWPHPSLWQYVELPHVNIESPEELEEWVTVELTRQDANF